MSWELAHRALARPRLEVRFSAVGTLQAEAQAAVHLAQAGLYGLSASPRTSSVARALLGWARRPGVSGRMAHNALRLASRLRAPLDPAELAQMDVFFSFYAGIPAQARRARSLHCGIFVHDLTPILLPQHSSPQQVRGLRRILSTIRPEDLVVVNSECTRRDLCAHLGRDPATVAVVPLAADTAMFRPVTDPATLVAMRARYGLGDGPYLLSLHSAAPHKNMDMLIRAHASYRSVAGQDALPLVIAGGKGDPRAELVTAGLEPSALSGVTFAGFVDDADLAPLYSGAKAFFFPSLYEGFGLPVLEALLCGVPVFSSRAASLPEVMAPLPLAHRGPDRLLNPTDEGAWAEAFHAAKHATRLDAAALARLSEAFCWDRSVDLLAKTLGAPGRASVQKWAEP